MKSCLHFDHRFRRTRQAGLLSALSLLALTGAAAFERNASYSIPLLMAPVSTSYKTAGAVWVSATVRRLMFYEAEFGQTGTPVSTDVQCAWDISRIGATNLMVGTAVVPQPYDPADASPAALAVNLVTTEPTYTTAASGLFLKTWGINQRGSYRWRALDDGDNILVAATAGNGLGIRTSSAGWNASSIGNMSFVER